MLGYYKKLENRDSNGKSGVVSSGRIEATEIGIEILKKGGNAFDAAVAVAFALGVCEPNASGLGGGGFMTAQKNKENIFLDFRERSPKAAIKDNFSIGKMSEEKKQGGKAVAVPGELKGLFHILKKYGSMEMKDIINPSINLAEKGFLITKDFHKDLIENRDKLGKYSSKNNPYYLKNIKNKVETFKNHNLAETLRIIRDNGEEIFYGGEIGKSIVKAVQENGGFITLQDLENYFVRELDPVIGEYRGYSIISTSPPSSGGVHLIQALNILENFEIEDLEVNSYDYIHIFSEVFKIIYKDRAEYIGDPDYTKVPINGLTSKMYAEELFGKIRIKSKIYKHGNPWKHESQDTTHLSIIDNMKNIVSMTKSISGFFGSCIVPEKRGFPLNNQMRGFSKNFNSPNNVGPEKKPLSSMTPTIVTKDDNFKLALGSPGGGKIIPIVIQILSKILDANMELQNAVDSPRFYDGIDEFLYYERRINNKAIDKINALGHNCFKLKKYDRKLGSVSCAMINNGKYYGAADFRR